jgi:hypothetical protein
MLVWAANTPANRAISAIGFITFFIECFSTPEERRAYKREWASRKRANRTESEREQYNARTREWAAANPGKMLQYRRRSIEKQGPEEVLKKGRERARKWALNNPIIARERKRQQHIKHRESEAEYARKHYAEHADELREKSRIRMREAYRKWREENPILPRQTLSADEVRRRSLESGRRYQKENAEQIRDKNRKRMRKMREVNPERVRAWNRQWYAENPEQKRAYDQNYRAAKAAAPGRYTRDDVRRLYQAQRGKCAACSVEITTSGKNRYHVDHITPLKPRKGEVAGTNDPANLQLLCPFCNLSKNNLSPKAWAARRQKRLQSQDGHTS